MQIHIFLPCITNSPMHSWEQKSNYVEGTSEFASGMTWLEETQISNQPRQGCLKSKGVVVFCACLMETARVEIQLLFAGNYRPAGKFLRGERVLHQPLPPSIFAWQGNTSSFLPSCYWRISHTQRHKLSEAALKVANKPHLMDLLWIKRKKTC